MVHYCEMNHRAKKGRAQDADRECERYRLVVRDGELPLNVRPNHANCAEREIQNTRTAINQYESLRD